MSALFLHFPKIYSLLRIKTFMTDIILIHSNIGTWGGIWSAPNRYSLSSTSKYQTDVNLVIQFNDTHNIWSWSPGSDAVDNRVPYIVDHKLTTSAKGTDNKPLGTITGLIYAEFFFKWNTNIYVTDMPNIEPCKTQRRLIKNKHFS